jgi:hypothetical protein
MIKKPSQTEWDTSALLAARRAYLDADLSFEDIASRVVHEAKIINSKIKRYKRLPPGATTDAVNARHQLRCQDICHAGCRSLKRSFSSRAAKR